MIKFLASMIEFLVSSVKFLASMIEFLVSSVKFLASMIEFLASSVKFLASMIEFLASSAEFLALMIKFLVLGVKFLASMIEARNLFVEQRDDEILLDLYPNPDFVGEILLQVETIEILQKFKEKVFYSIKIFFEATPSVVLNCTAYNPFESALKSN